MWIDDRGSEVLAIPECRRLLAIAAKEHRHGHIGVPQGGAPLVLPVDFAMHGPDIVLRIGEGLFHQVDARLVAFQVDGVIQMGGVEGDQSEQTWSVLVQGLAIEDVENVPTRYVPHPEVIDPGQRVVRIRADVVTGRRFVARPSFSDCTDSAVDP
jgi:Pyridoxamine 5'-phosphate oxidase